jgi:polyisoprenoid-binding protein YceI
MKQPLQIILATAIAAVVVSTAAVAAPEKFVIDPNHSLVGFSIRHFFTKVTGRFKEVSGTILYDAKDLSASSVDVTLQTASITTENDRRDADLRSPNFFEADKNPTITFKSTKVIPGKDNAFQIEGDLNMHGVTKKVTLNATFLGAGDTGMMGRRAGFEATTTVNRLDYGITWNKQVDATTKMLGDDVAITLSIEAMVPREGGPGGPPPPPPGTDKK